MPSIAAQVGNFACAFCLPAICSNANAKSIPFVAIAGETEIAEGKVMLKNMITGEQKLLAAEEMIAEILK